MPIIKEKNMEGVKISQANIINNEGESLCLQHMWDGRWGGFGPSAPQQELLE